MPQVSQTLTCSWEVAAVILSNTEINLLFEIFGPLPVTAQFTLRAGLIGMGKSRILIGNQDQLLDILYGYINALNLDQQYRVKELIERWTCLDTKVVKFDSAERVRFRVSAPAEERALILARIQTYIPIFRTDEIEGYSQDSTGYPGAGGNTISRG